MAKNQKKPLHLSMGGVVPRRPKVEDIKKPALSNPEKINLKKILKSSKKSKNKKNRSVFKFFKKKAPYFLVAGFIAGLYLFDIGNFPPSAPVDQASAISYGHLSDIETIKYLPSKLALVAASKTGLQTHAMVRLLSILILFFSLLCFYKLLSRWMRKRMAAVGLLLYGSSTWMLAQTRQDNIAGLLLSFMPIFLYLCAMFIRSESILVKSICALLLTPLIFVPGAFWFFLAALVFGLIYFRDELKIKQIILPVIVSGILLAGYGLVITHLSLNNYAQFAKVLGSDVAQLPQIESVKSNALNLPSQLFVSGPNDNSFWLAATPIIDFVSIIFLIAGFIYLFKTKLHPVRKKLLLALLVLSLILILLNGFAYISLILPLIYIIIAIGITYLLDQWLIIFPTNPLPRIVGIIMVGVIVLMVCGYHIERYFIGWPKTEEYHQIFRD